MKLAALILFSTSCLIQAAEVPRPISLTVVELGGKVTLNCSIPENDVKLLHWYKQRLGYMAETVAIMVQDRWAKVEPFKDSRFNVTKLESQISLTISNVSKEDEATYLCHAGTMYSQKFVNGTFLATNDPKKQKSACEEHLTLQFSFLSTNKENKVLCQSERSVFWFRIKSKGFHPGIIYLQRNISDEDEDRCCSFSACDSSDAGTFSGAVVTCKPVVFGEGTKEETKSNTVVITLGGLLAFCVITIILLILYIKKIKICECHKGGKAFHDHLKDDKSSEDAKAMGVTYATVQIRTKRGNKKEELPQDSIYSLVKPNQHQLSSL